MNTYKHKGEKKGGGGGRRGGEERGVEGEREIEDREELREHN
jgi:hypothetical protein